MPANPAKTKRPAPKAPETPVDDKAPLWKYMCIRSDVHSRLDEQRRKRAQQLGFKLSWTKFFVLLAEDLERKSAEEGS
jgi:hypothetical protein